VLCELACHVFREGIECLGSYNQRFRFRSLRMQKGRGGGLSDNFISMEIVFPICRIIIFETMSILFPPQNVLFLIKKYPSLLAYVCMCAVCVPCVWCIAFPKGLYQDIYDMIMVHGKRERSISIDRSIVSFTTHANVPITKTTHYRLMVNLYVT